MTPDMLFTDFLSYHSSSQVAHMRVLARCGFEKGTSLQVVGGRKESPKRRAGRSIAAQSVIMMSASETASCIPTDQTLVKEVNLMLWKQRYAVLGLVDPKLDPKDKDEEFPKKKTKKIHLVFGNEAADLDSVVCALVYSVMTSRSYEGQSDNDELIAVPVICIPRGDLVLRNELVWLLRETGIDCDALVFQDELDIGQLQESNSVTEVHLVDHNALAQTSPFQGFHDKITTVIDHHHDENTYPESAATTIYPTGSCATLVGERFADEFATKNKEKGDPLVALLLSAVAMDTQLLQKEVTRVDIRDERMLKKLAELFFDERVSLDDPVSKLYGKLKQKRGDQSALSTPDLLRRDYKQWRVSSSRGGEKNDDEKNDDGDAKTSWTVGVASFGVPLGEMGGSGVGAETIKADCFAFALQRNLDVLVLMSAFDDPNTNTFTRQIAAIANFKHKNADTEKENVLDALFARGGVLWNSLGGLSLVTSDRALRAFGGNAFEQGDAKGSRKKAQPALAEFFERLESSS